MKWTAARTWLAATLAFGPIASGGAPPVSASLAQMWCVTEYALTDLGTLGGPSSQVADIADSGTVVGNAFAADGQGFATMWVDGQPVSLGGLGRGAGHRHRH
jgi:uncharacterized membrane protein